MIIVERYSTGLEIHDWGVDWGVDRSTFRLAGHVDRSNSIALKMK